ncbi:MAG: isoleucine--tRNA ligase [Nanoarchaeota archaeon]
MYIPQEKEKEILSFWENKKIFDKLRKKNKGKKKWSFIDGPITANNPMGVHHAWGRTYKDLYQRFKAMQGFDQRYQNGFDCQGLWVEREEEKDLGLKNKKDIENYGILKFVQACKRRVEKFSKIQTEQSKRLGQWMDWDNSYYTMTDNNNLHNWYLLKNYFDKGMLHKGKDAVPWCWRCGTASSKHDIATEGYKEVTHTALFMQFPLKNNPDEYFIIFTTTPWTVPANVAIAVNANLDYVKVENEGVKYWIAESRVEELEGKYKILQKKKGSELEGIEYVMPYYDLEEQQSLKAPHKVVLWGLASGEEGTGIVHIAPGCGAEDFDLGKKLKLPAISPLDDGGVYQNGFGEFSGSFYSDANKKVLTDLEQRRFVYKTKQYKHRYPHCWRCGQELVFRLVDEWYIKCTADIRKKLIAENKKVTWFPEYGKVRQEEWFKNMGDWLISRKRYWGLPLPIWECKCGEIKVFGSLKELREKAIDKKKVDELPELHRPWIDEIKIKCDKCKNEVSRVLDVGDAWLDAGIVSFSTLNYLNDKKYWKEWFPADFICENMPGQYRGWFNALFWAAIMLEGKTPFKSLLGYESLKDEKGEEMHKSKGNAIWFDEAVEKVGADPMRLIYCLQDPAQELKFGFNVLREPKNNINILHNMNNLIIKDYKSGKLKIEDKWILSKINSLIKYVTNELESLRPHNATRALQNFWLNDLSRRYIQMGRDRLSENDKTINYILSKIYSDLLKLCAPIMPFLTESIWQELREKKIVEEESVHLSYWPEADKKKIDKKLEKDFESVMKIVETGLRERDKAKIGLRWPLAKAIIRTKESMNKELEEIIARQLNVKKVELKQVKDEEIKISLDTKMNKELEAEGYSREVIRKIQAERKNLGMRKGQLADIKVYADKELVGYLNKNKKFIAERVNAGKIEFSDDKIPGGVILSTIQEKKIGLFFCNS